MDRTGYRRDHWSIGVSPDHPGDLWRLFLARRDRLCQSPTSPWTRSLPGGDMAVDPVPEGPRQADPGPRWESSSSRDSRPRLRPGTLAALAMDECAATPGSVATGSLGSPDRRSRRWYIGPHRYRSDDRAGALRPQHRHGWHVGIALYVLAWLFIPVEGEQESVASRARNDRRGIALRPSRSSPSSSSPSSSPRSSERGGSKRSRGHCSSVPAASCSSGAM